MGTTTLSIMAYNVTTFSLMTLSLKGVFVALTIMTFSTLDTQYIRHSSYKTLSI
jgi:hypothetical protein